MTRTPDPQRSAEDGAPKRPPLPPRNEPQPSPDGLRAPAQPRWRTITDPPRV